MTTLVPLQPEEFAAFAEAAITSYAHDNVQCGRWTAEDALNLARADFERLLPQGLATPNNYVYKIVDEANATPVGFIWFAVLENAGTRSAYVYNVQVKAEFRRRGHARAAFKALEEIAAAEGLASIGLHVFGFNVAAQALYASLGYGVNGINMRKAL